MESERADAFHHGQYSLLERIATGAPLDDVLEGIVRLIESQADGMLCTLLRVDTASGTVRTAAAPSVPPEFARALDGLKIGPHAGSCGRAAFLKERVITEDIDRDPNWADYKHLALPHGLRACWSTPVLSQSQEILGTFAMYYHVPRRPTQEEMAWVGVATHLAAIAIMHEANRVLESQLQQAQRIQALGTLAGGIAHDFSNILSAIRGHADLALMEPMTNVPVHESLQEISRASRRASDLVRRLLTFSRHDAPRREVVPVAEVVDEAVKLIRPSLPRKVDVRLTVSGRAPLVRADPTQLHQIVMNFASNAGYAMRERGGVVDVVIDEVEFSDHDLNRPADLMPGRYARVRVTDQGTGMDEVTVSRAFEPFFTTKPAGEGTGLGLSVVYGIAKNHGGSVQIQSTVGAGTSITLCLPVTNEPRVRMHTPPRPAVRVANRHIMYVDDDEVLVRLASRVLNRYGYRVTGHSNPVRALEDFVSRPREFDAIVTDLSMPELSGHELAAKVREVHAYIPIVLVSGYVSPEDAERARGLGLESVLPKPQTIHEFADMLRDRLDAAPQLRI